ncbi:aldolase catalytic domain-containing protein [Aeromonas hydrophila]|uniref:aldolase catalytic domain-containing protein n=2 Tax=Bacteria TaxID=2 RepID=UPI001B3A353D|nr:aldolase catalytic domain-containing protein [Aeromonas hydrophila]MBQ4677646.1 pyruvate carboxyltransferase [Aeromonas hydrophila]MBW3816250.1 pyruvate carboxyltransferase [Aeromonas hydrophila]MCF7676591.1 aldolase catalytic domain-containing protein [Aeromonas hydrophila]MCF7773329.1 aldolase catalytic domain-containing protein [Aeromonas hydrophila]
MQKILDCTLRDGGYYNNWDFTSEIVDAYLNAVAKAKIDYVELGLRNYPKNFYSGPFAYTTEAFLKTLTLPDGPVYGVMVDAKTIIDSGKSVIDSIQELFVPAAESKIGLVRIAAHFNEAELCGQMVKTLKDMGYVVGLNLMQAGGKDSDLIAKKVQVIAESSPDVIYFADSLGNMDSDEVKRIATIVKENWSGAVGIHTHNNMGQAMANTMTARSNGVSWLDVTVTGMGRGAGNAQTENLLAELDGIAAYQPISVYELVIRHFEPMQREYGWGSNILYYLGAKNDIHPTYIQNMLSNPNYGTEEIVGAVEYLKKLDGTTSYNGGILEEALTIGKINQPTECESDLSNIFLNKEVLLVTNTPNTKKHKLAIEEYIKSRQPIVIGVNTTHAIDSDLFNYFAVSHNSKILSEIKTYTNLTKPVFLPKNRFDNEELCKLDNVTIIDYGISLEKSKLSIHRNYSVLPYDNTAAYALCIAIMGNAKNIKLVGFDGYNANDRRQMEMNDIFTMIGQQFSDCLIQALTPTTYTVNTGSIYAPYI